MSRPNPSPALWLAFAATLAAMLWSARLGGRMGLTLAAATFAAMADYSAYRIASESLTETGTLDTGAGARVLAELTRITALTYAWGGTALISIYRFTPLHWQHGWQYGSAMLLIAAGLITYVGALTRAGSKLAAPSAVERVVHLSVLHGAAALFALGWLTASGKLDSPKGDWAANAVFVCGGCVILWLCYLAVRTHRQLKRLAA